MGFAGDIREAVRVGLASARANVVPMVVLWAMAVALAVGYYFVPGVAAALEPLKRWQVESGWFAALLNRVAFCGILPGVFLLTVRAIRPRRPWRTILAYCVWAGAWGVLCDRFFTLQTALFRSGTDFTTVALKTAVEQLVWTALFCVPLGTVFFFWLSRDFSWRRTRAEWPRRFVRDACLPILIADWCVWVPVSVAVYCFPLPLQIQLTGFAGAFWMLVGLQIGVGTKGGAHENRT